MSSSKNRSVFNSVEEMIGSTPVVKLGPSLKDLPQGSWAKGEGAKSEKIHSIKSELWAKLEFQNPGGSVKDRIAKEIIEEAFAKGQIKAGGTVVEATSGNTGAGLALMAVRYGLKAVLVMPDKMSSEKVNTLRALGAKVVITPSTATPNDEGYYCNVAKAISQKIPGALLANQYFNPANPGAHYKTTGPEIWEQMEGRIDAFIAGIGTGGTLSGTAKYLKEKNPKIKIVAIDPVGSIYTEVLKTGKIAGQAPYLVEGIGEDMIPGTMDLKSVDVCVPVNDEESFAGARLLAQKEGLFVGGSCGSAWFGAVEFLALHEERGGAPLRAVVLLPDSGSKYLSKVFNPKWLKQNHVLSKIDVPVGGPVEYFTGAKMIEGVE